MNRTELIAHLRALDACDEALAWIEQTPGEPDDLWAACQRGDWMIWLLAAVDYDERTMRHLACDVAEDVLPIYERAHPDDRRPRDAIAVARRYADGAATRRELIAASDAAWAAARAAADAAAEAAAWAASNAASLAAPSNASMAASWAALSDAAWSAAMSRHADIVRARVSWADVERVMGESDRAEEIDCDQDSRHAELAQDDTETEPRPPTCECQWEAGDSPCRVHGEDEVALEERDAALLAPTTPTPAPTLTDAELRALREEGQRRRQRFEETLRRMQVADAQRGGGQ